MEHIHALSYTLPDTWEAAVDGWMTYLIAAGTSAATRKTRRAHVRRVARELDAADPRDVTADELLKILGRPGFSIEHRRGVRASLASFYHWCLKTGVVAADPTLELPSIRAAVGAPKPATDEMWRALLATADPRTALMARLACEAGLRRAEVACVHSDDLNAGIGGAELIVHGKGAKQRVVPITVTLAAAIVKAVPFGGFLFPGKIDGHMSADRVGHLVSKVMPKGWSMHKLRHRAATRGFAGTGNLRAVQEFLGHTSVATTQRYVAIAARDIRAVAEAAAAQSSSFVTVTAEAG
jgi:site-specific recombinase XerD